MTTIAQTRTESLTPEQIHPTLRRHILADGLPLVMDLERCHGAWLYDSLGRRELLDLFTCFATSPVGYNHPKLAEPEFLERIRPAVVNKPSNSDLYTHLFAEFVDTLGRVVPAPLNRHMFFIEGGAVAVENALKAAFDWKVRKNQAAGRGEKGHRILHFREAFHGRSGYTLSLTNTADPRKYEYFPRFDWPRITNPKLSFPVTAEVEAQVEAAERQAVSEIQRALAEHPHDVAALIIEPVQGEGGDNYFRPWFLRRLRELADENEFLLIFDEIQTGFATTGRWWCFEHYEVVPDIFAFGKKTQVCGICAGDRLDEVDSVFQVPSRINSTWGGNLADMVRCQRYVEIIEEEGLLENATRVGRLLLDGVRELESRFPGKVSNARGLGMLVAFDLPDTETRSAARVKMRDEGVLAMPSGVRSIRFRPPVSLTREEAVEGLARVRRALEAQL
jgi:L-lysine 6-transaminase